MLKSWGRRIISIVLITILVICGVITTPIVADAEEQFPDKLDLRDRGVVTPVKFQNPWGSCWAFGGIAAAETSILSDRGETNEHYKEIHGCDFDLSEKHLVWFGKRPITAKTNSKQAGEGFYMFRSDTDVNAAYDTGGKSLYITTLFSTGVGPVFEVVFPYQGAEGLTDLQYIEKYPDKVMGTAIEWAEINLFQESYEDAYNKLINPPYDDNTQMWVDILTRNGIFDPYPDVTAITIEQFQDICYQVYLLNYQKSGSGNSYYSELDDWTIPELNKDGNVNRDYYSGYTLLDGNILPDMRIMENGKWTGINQKGVDAVKSELSKGHGVSISFCADASLPGQVESGRYINLDTWAHYTYEEKDTTHAVCIVGWDDNYSKENFNEGHQPPGDGAWIVKNSWGSETDWYDNGTGATINKNAWGVVDDNGNHTGYFYLSYYDKSITNAETMTFDTDFALGKGTFYTWAYDYMPARASGKDGTRVKNEKVTRTANVFSNDTNEPLVLSAVSTKTAHPNASVEYSIYRVDDKTKNFEEGTLLGKESDTYEYEGFHRENLDKGILINPGEKFAIVVEETIVEDGNKLYEFNINAALSKEIAQMINAPDYGVAVVNPGESFIYDDGKWTDWTEVSSSYMKKTEMGQQAGDSFKFAIDNFSIKAYLVPGTTDMYRLYNPNSGEHFYTSSDAELMNLMYAGWKAEGVAWNAPIVSDTPVYRLYTKGTGEHHYTTDAAERDHLIEVGWQDEGIGWYSADPSGTPLYRLYNPNATQGGSHHYTADVSEKDWLVGLGWKYEGIGWYGE